MPWSDALPDELRSHAVGLTERSCRFLWRDRAVDRVSAEPSGSGECWLELRRDDALLGFAGPVPCPPSVQAVRAAGEYLIRQAQLLLE